MFLSIPAVMLTSLKNLIRSFVPMVVTRGLCAVTFLIGSLMVNVAFAGVYEDFFQSLQRNDSPAVSRLLQRGFDPNTTGPNGMVALHMAIMENAFGVAETLIRAPGIQLDKRNQNDETPLMLAALRGNIELSRLLLSRGADVNKPGWTALHYAASGEQTEIVRMLLDQYAYIDAEAPSGNTPLMMAVMYGPEANINVLLSAGADPTLKNNAGRTAMDLAEGINRTGAVNLLRTALVVWRENEAIEAARMKRVEAQMAQEEAAEQEQEARESAAAAARALQESAEQGRRLQVQAEADRAAASKNAIQVVDLPPLIPGQAQSPVQGPFKPLLPGQLIK
jgi:hypothetical protein